MNLDIGHIIHYILNYETGIPLIIFIGIIIVVCNIVLILYYTRINNRMFVRKASVYMFIGYVALVLCTTIIFRTESDEMKYVLCPFKSYIGLYNKMLAQNILNIVLFMPIGFLAGAALKKKHILNAIKIGVGFSLFIEVVQLISKRGVCNIDDVIHNTLGCAIGFAGFVLCYKMARRIA